MALSNESNTLMRAECRPYKCWWWHPESAHELREEAHNQWKVADGEGKCWPDQVRDPGFFGNGPLEQEQYQVKHVQKRFRRMNWITLVICFMAVGCSGSHGQPSHPVSGMASMVKKSDANELAAHVDWKFMRAFWQRAMSLPGVNTGPSDSNKRLVVYFDPNCPVCARQWRVLQPYLKQVRIHWIPVAYIDSTSERRAAAILAADDPAAALARNERQYDFSTDKGGLALPATVPVKALRKVRMNTQQAIRSKDLIATPTTGFELYPQKRYYRMMGLVDADSMKVAIAELGHTMNPWKHPQSKKAHHETP